MSQFWDTFADATALSIETMGEEVLLDGEPVQAIVDPLQIQEMAASGGRKVGVGGAILVAVGTVLRDGMSSVVRKKDGKVDSWEDVGGGILVTIGSFNRWDGEVPGV